MSVNHALARGPLAAYAALGLPLAMLALPVYVLLPPFYAEATGLSLATLGAVLLFTRLADALIDPWLGVWADRVRARASWRRAILIAALPLAMGFVLLFSPPAELSGRSAVLWLVMGLAAAYLGYSAASVAYQAWGAELAHDDAGRARVTGAREGLGLVGVVLASILPFALGMSALVASFLVCLALALCLLARVPEPAASHASSTGRLSQALASPGLRWLLLVLLFNGVAAALPATLVGFFVADRLELATSTGVFLALYFLGGAASMPVWTALARRWPLPSLWLAGMALSIVGFASAAWLGAGDFAGYAWVCLVCGLALGADLAMPPALLARVIEADGAQGRASASYFGLWNFVVKLNLALAAGIALPALQAWGYAPGARDPGALQALSLAYAVLPIAFKLVAAALLLWGWRRGRY